MMPVPTNESFTIKDVIAFEKIMDRGEKIDLRVEHYFAYKVYARHLFIPKGVILTGKIHKFSQINILFRGIIEIVIEGQLKQIEAPYLVVSPPGTKRLARAIEDCEWITFLGTDLTDPEKIESEMLWESSDKYLEEMNKQLQLGLD